MSLRRRVLAEEKNALASLLLPELIELTFQFLPPPFGGRLVAKWRVPRLKDDELLWINTAQDGCNIVVAHQKSTIWIDGRAHVHPVITSVFDLMGRCVQEYDYASTRSNTISETMAVNSELAMTVMIQYSPHCSPVEVITKPPRRTVWHTKKVGDNPGEFYKPTSVVFHPDNTVFISEIGSSNVRPGRIQRFTPDGHLLQWWYCQDIKPGAWQIIALRTGHIVAVDKHAPLIEVYE